MVGGTLLIRCSKEDFINILDIDYDKEPSEFDYSMTYDTELDGIVLEYESNSAVWDDENRQGLLKKIENWLALGKVIEMNEWWVDESRKGKIDARKKWAKDNTKTIENWRKFYRKVKSDIILISK